MKELAIPLVLLLFFAARVLWDRAAEGRWDFSP